MVQDNLEIERKYDVGESTAVPPVEALTGLPGVVGVESPEPWTLHATYYDTPGLALATQGVTLRRRSGGEDPGWTLKLPVGESARQELTAPLGPEGEPVPEELLQPVRVHVRREPVVPVVELRTERRARRLVGPDREVLATVTDDQVTARPRTRGLRRSSWREWEVELGDGGRDGLLEAAEEVLGAAGATASSSSSKLARALGNRPAPLLHVPEPRRQDPAGHLLRYAVHVHLTHLKEQDQRLRRGLDDSVHQLRIAARRVRAALTSYREELDGDLRRFVRDELRWLGRELGGARDAQVMRERLDRHLEVLPPDLVRGPVRDRVRHELQEQHAEGCAQAMQALDSGRYFALLDHLDQLVADLPGDGVAAEQTAREAAAAAVERERRRVRKAAKAVRRADAPPETDLALHELRKATKRLRYAAESARPVTGKSMRRYAKAVKAVQDRLGEHQDSVVARATLVELSEQARRHGEDGFTYGVLHAGEREQAAPPRRLRQHARSLL